MTSRVKLSKLLEILRLEILPGGTMAEKKMPPFLFLSFFLLKCVPVALATYVLDTQESYMQVPKMFVQE